MIIMGRFQRSDDSLILSIRSKRNLKKFGFLKSNSYIYDIENLNNKKIFNLARSSKGRTDIFPISNDGSLPSRATNNIRGVHVPRQGDRNLQFL
jgi:hypothetical protein